MPAICAAKLIGQCIPVPVPFLAYERLPDGNGVSPTLSAIGDQALLVFFEDAHALLDAVAKILRIAEVRRLFHDPVQFLQRGRPIPVFDGLCGALVGLIEGLGAAAGANTPDAGRQE